MPAARIKLLSYNIHKGFSLGRKFVLENIRTAIRSTGTDLVFLQEVLGRHDGHQRRIPRWPRQSQFEYLADEVWTHYAYGENAVYSSGHHGNAILSKHPFTSQKNVDISVTRFARRGLLHGVIQIPRRKTPVHLICIHLDLRDTDRMLQAELLADHIDSHVPHRAPLILAGDFNDWQQKMTRHLEETLQVQEVFMALHNNHARTFPARAPALKLDRVYYRGFNPIDAQRLHRSPWNRLSDHVPLYAELEFAK